MKKDYRYKDMNRRSALTLSRTKLIDDNREFLTGKSLLEFGVYMGHSLTEFSILYGVRNMPRIFFGFDSFKGLPEEKLDKNNPTYWSSGRFNVSDIKEDTIEKLKYLLPSINIITGWFHDTLNEEISRKVKQNEIGIIHLDCDIYSSTLYVWEWIITNDLLSDGTLIVYDDWGGYHEKNVNEYECVQGRAHKEICEKYGLNLEFISCDVIQEKYHEVCMFRYKKN